MRTRDATVHNMIANHPETVRALCWNPEDHPETNGWLLFDNLTDDDHYMLLHNGRRDFTTEDFAHGMPEDVPTLAMIFEWSAPGVWQVHTLSLPWARGRLVDDAKMLIREMFVVHGAAQIWGQTPLDNIAARKFNAKIGAHTVGLGHHHVAGDVEYFSRYRNDWLAEQENYSRA